MRKGLFGRAAALALAVVFLALLASCATVVQVKDHIPAKVNMSGLKNLAVRRIMVADGVGQNVPPLVRAVSTGDGSDQVKVFTSYSPLLCSRLALRLQNGLVDGLRRADYFVLLSPDETERLFEEGSMLGKVRGRFIESGVDAILSSKLSLLSYDEFITSESHPMPPESGKTATDFFLNTSAVLVFDYRIIDVARNCLAASGSQSRKIEDKSLVATYEKDASGAGGFSFTASNGPSLDYQFMDAVDEMAANVPVELAPRWETSYEALMESGAGKEDGRAYELAAMGDVDAAFKIFDARWREGRSLPAGYNAAILLYAKGRLSDAVLYMRDVAGRTGSYEAGRKLAELEEKQRLWSIAERQLSGERPDATVEEFEIRSFFGE